MSQIVLLNIVTLPMADGFRESGIDCPEGREVGS